jgi:hypothetical protein
LSAAFLAQGCGITPDQLPPQYPADHQAITRPHPAHPPKRQGVSRFADIAQARFFVEHKPAQVVPVAPSPSAIAPEPKPLLITLEPAESPLSDLSSCRPAKAAIQQVQGRIGGSYGENEDYVSRPPVSDPRKLKKITEIQPFASYEPDPLVRARNPCENLCPRPDGAPCIDEGENAKACPAEVVLSNEQYIPRDFEEKVFAWEASNIYYNPLYFEDVALERYGHTYPCWVQPFASVGKFSVQLAGLPYQMGIDPICKKMYPLGYYRPGECAPKLCYQIPWNTRAAMCQGGVTTGLIFLIP